MLFRARQEGDKKWAHKMKIKRLSYVAPVPMTNFLAENGAGGGGAIFYTPLGLNMLRVSKNFVFQLSSYSFKSMISCSLYIFVF